MFCTVRTLLLVDTEAQAENKICHRSAKNPFVVVVWKNYQMSMRMGNILFSLCMWKSFVNNVQKTTNLLWFRICICVFEITSSIMQQCNQFARMLLQLFPTWPTWPQKQFAKFGNFSLAPDLRLLSALSGFSFQSRDHQHYDLLAPTPNLKIIWKKATLFISLYLIFSRFER